MAVEKLVRDLKGISMSIPKSLKIQMPIQNLSHALQRYTKDFSY